MAKITKIMKFGGSSVGSPKMIRKVGEIVSSNSRKESVAVVVSAFQGVTDQLLKCAKLAATREHRERSSRRMTASNSVKLENELKALQERHISAVKQLARNKKSVAEDLKYVDGLFAELKAALGEISSAKKVSAKNLDLVASFGERLSAYIVAASMKNGYFADAREMVKTDGFFVNASVDFLKTNRKIQNYFRNPSRTGKKGIPVITGFLGSTDKNETTTLGRGGSDYSGAIFGAALNVKAVEIWTDVDGVMSADPRLVKNAVVLPEMSYEEAIEMAYFGAKVIHPATMLPAIKKGIPIVIKNTFNPSAPGTWIKKDVAKGMLVKGITAIDDVAIVNVAGVNLAGIPGSAARVFATTARAKANVILISQASSEHTICFAIKSAELPAALKGLEKEFSKEVKSGKVSISALQNQAVVAMVGDGMRGVPGIAGKLFSALGDNVVNITAIAQGGSERNISFVVDSSDKNRALNFVHEKFFKDNPRTQRAEQSSYDGNPRTQRAEQSSYDGNPRTLGAEQSSHDGDPKNIFLIGTGTIGKELLKQISVLQKQDRALRVVGLMDSKHMLLNESGIPADKALKLLKKGESADFSVWLKKSEEIPVGNKIFTDCTASEDIAKKYLEVAKAGFHIVTPNKKFNTRSLKEYRALREILAQKNRQFLYETNVGAGLPLISTIKDLLLSGDSVTKIEGIFSGTLSYLFNNYEGSRPFSEIVAEAKKLGYTEPDPREDLNGNDVGRKLLVLAREIGWQLEFKDVVIENLVPEDLRGKITPAEFISGMKHHDGYFKKILEKAYAQNKVLRYVARLGPVRGRSPQDDRSHSPLAKIASNGMGLMATASLQMVDLDNPLASTRGADNLFAIYTRRYKNRPLVVQGPGAGAEVTAAGVLGDILKV